MSIPEEVVNKLVPEISAEEEEELQKFFMFSEKHYEKLNEKLVSILIQKPVWNNIISNIPPDVMKENSKKSHDIQKDAILNSKWIPYIEHNLSQGVMYAQMGLEFHAWFEVVSLYRRLIVDCLQSERLKENDFTDILAGLNKMMDVGLSIIGEGYIHEKRRVIEKQRREQEVLIKELESFAYIVSHDLKTPLRGIANLSAWIAQDYEKHLDDTGKEYLSLLHNRVNRMEALIDGILTYSRIGRIDAEFKKIDPNIVIDEVKNMLAIPDNVDVILDQKLPVLHYSETGLVQVFSNLISNAIKYCDKGHVEIHIGFKDHKSYYEFYVSDNGPGIPKEFHEKVFQIFQTLHTKDEVDSTGIGLTIVKKVIETFGGSIWIESKKSEGTTFRFTINKN